MGGGGVGRGGVLALALVLSDVVALALEVLEHNLAPVELIRLVEQVDEVAHVGEIEVVGVGRRPLSSSRQSSKLDRSCSDNSSECARPGNLSAFSACQKFGVSALWSIA